MAAMSTILFVSAFQVMRAPHVLWRVVDTDFIDARLAGDLTLE
jgi:hypothetical protein